MRGNVLPAPRKAGVSEDRTEQTAAPAPTTSRRRPAPTSGCSTIFRRDLADPEWLAARREHARAMILSDLAPPPGGA